MATDETKVKSYRNWLTASRSFDTSARASLTNAVHIFPELFFAAARILVLDSQNVFENLYGRAPVAR